MTQLAHVCAPMQAIHNRRQQALHPLLYGHVGTTAAAVAILLLTAEPGSYACSHVTPMQQMRMSDLCRFDAHSTTGHCCWRSCGLRY